MQRQVPNDGLQDTRTRARSRKARKWARLSLVCLIGLCLSAIWQERRLAPPVHDQMQRMAGLALEHIEGNEHLAEALNNARKSYAKFTEDG